MLHFSQEPPAEGYLARDGLIRRTAPFGISLILGFALGPLWGSTDLDVLLVATVAAAAVIIAVMLMPWTRLPRWFQALPILLIAGVVAILRHATGGPASGYAPLLLMVPAWFALYGSRAELFAGVAALAVAVVSPVLLYGEPVYASGEWRRAIFLVLIATTLGLAVHSMVASLRSTRAIEEQLETRKRLLGEAARLHEGVTQHLAVAKMALETGDPEGVALGHLDEGLTAAKRITAHLMFPEDEGAADSS